MFGEPGLAFERPGVSARKVVWFAGGFLLFAAATAGALTIYYRLRIAGAATNATSTFPSPRLQVEEPADLLALVSRARIRLDSYEWVDRARGIVHVPIDVAMRRVVARGAAGFDPEDGKPIVPSPARDTPDRAPAGASR